MSGLETAIRNALDRSERTDADTRQRIYQSARNALDAGLKRQQVQDVTVITHQQHRLEALIERIETEERAATDRDRAPMVPGVEPDERLDGQAGFHRAERSPSVLSANREMPIPASDPLGPGDITAQRAGPSEMAPVAGVIPPVQVAPAVEPLAQPTGADDALLPAVSPDRRSRLRGAGTIASKQKLAAARPPAAPRRRGRRFLSSLMMVLTTLIVIFGAGAWWADSNGLLQPLLAGIAGLDTPVDDGTQTSSRGAGNPLDTADSFSADWIEVLDVTEAAGIRPGDKASAGAVTDEDGQRVAIVSRDAGPDGDVAIEVPANILAELSGKTSTIALTVRSGTAKPTEFSVECAFSTLGTCGRHRFTVLDEKVDMLVKVSFDRSLAPDAPGHLVINSDISGGAAGLDLFAIRVLPGQ